MDLIAYFKAWLAKNPLKEPIDSTQRAQYTSKVMEKIKALRTPALARKRLRLGWLIPRISLAAAAAAAIAFVLVGQPNRSVVLIADDIENEAELFFALDDTLPIEFEYEISELTEEMEAVDEFLIAESIPSEEELWLDQTLELLEEFGEDLPEDVLDQDADDRWLKELEWLDEVDLTSTS